MSKLTEIQMNLRANLLGKKHWEVDPNRTTDEQILTVDHLLDAHTKAILAWVAEVIGEDEPIDLYHTDADVQVYRARRNELRAEQRKRARL